MNKADLAQMIIDYNNGDGLTNMQLANKYRITNSTVRNKLIEAGVYIPQRMEKKNPKTARTAAWHLCHAERILRDLIDWYDNEESTITEVYKKAKKYFEEK